MPLRTLFLSLVALSLVGQAPPPAPAPDAAKPVREDGAYAHIQVTQGGQPVGEIVFKFFEKESPLTSANFIALANGAKSYTDPKTGRRLRRRFYDGLAFHRVIPQFMIQGGDPLGDGSGSIEVVKDEFANGLTFDVPGRVAMAHAGPGTASCQFFITEGPVKRLDGQYTIFGQVVEGQELVAKIARFPRNEDDKPNTTVRMAKVTIERVGAAPAPPARPAVGGKKGVAKKATK